MNPAYEKAGAERSLPFVDLILAASSEHPAPWRLAPLEFKYYGTVIRDANDQGIARLWNHHPKYSGPSERETEIHPDDPEYFCDSHHESAEDYARALRIIAIVNAGAKWVRSEECAA